MSRQPPFALILAPELLQGRAVVELPAGVVLHFSGAAPTDAPAPASEADESYRLIPLG